jgi:hypothetical protein
MHMFSDNFYVFCTMHFNHIMLTNKMAQTLSSTYKNASAIA